MCPSNDTEVFKVAYKLGDSWICCSQGEWSLNQVAVHRGFLEAHKIYAESVFSAEVDNMGQILLETMRKI